MGSAIGFLLKNRGYDIVGVSSRRVDSARQAAEFINCPYYEDAKKAIANTDIIFITTPDKKIKMVADELTESSNLRKGVLFVHTSGALSSKIMSSTKKKGALNISIHPLQTFPSRESACEHIPGSYFAMEGDEEALPVGRRIVEDLGGIPIFIESESKALYHAAACIACNYLVVLENAALDLMRKAGIEKEKGIKALFPIIRATLENLCQMEPSQALTGPIARGDVVTVKKHLEFIQKKIPDYLSLYKTMGKYTIPLARKKGSLGQKEADELEKILGGADNARQ